MRRLQKIILLNWYLLDCVELVIDGNTAFIGPNASGKSSILDAIQTLMCGAHGRFLTLNPSAGEKSSRSIRDYCLGIVRQIDDANKNNNIYAPREHALTYIVLVFTNNDTVQDSVSVGIAIRANIKDPVHTVDGRFIIHGALTLNDFLTTQSSNKKSVIAWKELRNTLRERYHDFANYTQPKAFVSAMLNTLCGNARDFSVGHFGLDVDQFLVNFRNAVTFAPLRDVSQFVRKFILEEKNIQITALQKSLQTYKEIEQKTNEVKQKIIVLEKILQTFERGKQKLDWHNIYSWLECELKIQQADESIEPRQQELGECLENIAQLDVNIQQHEAELTALNTKITELKILQTNNNEVQIAQKIEQDLKHQQREFDLQDIAWQNFVEKLQTIMHIVTNDAMAVVCNNKEIHKHVQALQQILSIEYNNLEQYLLQKIDANKLLQHVDNLQQVLQNLVPNLQQNLADVYGKNRAAIQELNDLKQRVERVQRGGADLHPHTIELQKCLAQEKIYATVLCDVVEVADLAWQDAVERYLRANREALIVEPEQAELAVALYRQYGKKLNLYDATLINTTKTLNFSERAPRNSLAALIVSENVHAKNFLQKMLSGIICVQTENELLTHERAITIDGMLHTGGAIRRLKPVHLMLGRSSKTVALENLQTRFISLANLQQQSELEINKLHEQLQQITKLVDCAVNLQTLPKFIHASNAVYSGLLDLKAQLAAYLVQAEHNIVVTLQHDVLAAQQCSTNLKQALELVRTEKEQLIARHSKLAEQIKQIQHEITVYADERAKIQQLGFAMELATNTLSELDEQFAADGIKAQLDVINKRKVGQLELYEKNMLAAKNQLLEYVHKYPLQHELDLTNNEAVLTWVTATWQHLVNTSLAEYADKAVAALKEAELAFRADFLGRLQENFDIMQEKLVEINTILHRHKFHGERYEFTYKVNPEFKAVLDFMQNLLKNDHDLQDMFTLHDKLTPEEQEIINKIRELLLLEVESSTVNAYLALADYRNYFIFDIKMHDLQTDTISLLSKRLGKGSGGEHQSPFYVAIGAALASAYKLQPVAATENDAALSSSNFALAVFDEAFNKLDMQNTENAINFLKELGIQVILAAPDEKHALMSAYLDTIVNVYRSGDAVYLDVEYVKQAAHALLNTDNPFRQPQLIDEMLQTMNLQGETVE